MTIFSPAVPMISGCDPSFGECTEKPVISPLVAVTPLVPVARSTRPMPPINCFASAALLVSITIAPPMLPMLDAFDEAARVAEVLADRFEVDADRFQRRFEFARFEFARARRFR